LTGNGIGWRIWGKGIQDLFVKTMFRALMLFMLPCLLFLTPIVADCQIKSDIKAYMKSKGYEPMYLQVVSKGGVDYLVVTDPTAIYAQTSFTKDVPYSVNTISFSDGVYFCKPTGYGPGISQFIDERGYEVSLSFATWTELKN
jgi:hypothetical protein